LAVPQTASICFNQTASKYSDAVRRRPKQEKQHADKSSLAGAPKL
jgi:hypothetical protein